MTATLQYTVHRAGPRIGAEIEGVDLTRRADDSTAQTLTNDFHRHNLATCHYAIDDYGDGPRAHRKVLAAGPENRTQDSTKEQS